MYIHCTSSPTPPLAPWPSRAPASATVAWRAPRGGGRGCLGVGGACGHGESAAAPLAGPFEPTNERGGRTTHPPPLVGQWRAREAQASAHARRGRWSLVAQWQRLWSLEWRVVTLPPRREQGRYSSCWLSETWRPTSGHLLDMRGCRKAEGVTRPSRAGTYHTKPQQANLSRRQVQVAQSAVGYLRSALHWHGRSEPHAPSYTGSPTWRSSSVRAIVGVAARSVPRRAPAGCLATECP